MLNNQGQAPSDMEQSNATQQNSKKRSRKSGKRPPKKISESYLHNAGLYYLQRFAASSHHFRTVMRRKIDRSCLWHKDQDRETCYTMLEELVVKFQESGLLDDESYARAMVTSLRRRGASRQMIHAKLRAKGLSKDDIEYALQQHQDRTPENDELVAGVKLMRRKRLGPFAAPEKISEESYKKWLAVLARGGYSYDMAQNLLDMNQDEAQQLLYSNH